MAGRLILMKNATEQIKGDCEAEGYKDWLPLGSISFGASANISHDTGTGSAHQTGISVRLPFGPWVAEMQQRLFHGRELGDVDIVEVQQVVDAQQKKTWKKVREIKLIEGYIESMSTDWNALSVGVEMSLQYTDFTFTWGDKVAHFNRSEKT